MPTEAPAPNEALSPRVAVGSPVGGQLQGLPLRFPERFECAKPGSFELTGFFAWARLLAKHRDDVFDGNDVQLVVGFKVDGNGVFRVEDNLVVLSERHVLVVLDLPTDTDDSAGYRGDLRGIWQGDTPFGFPFGFVFEDQDSGPDRLDRFERVFLGRHEYRVKSRQGKCRVDGVGGILGIRNLLWCEVPQA